MQNVLTIDYGTNIKQTGTTFDVYIIIHDVHVHECTNVQKLKTNNIYCCFNQNATHIFLHFCTNPLLGLGLVLEIRTRSMHSISDKPDLHEQPMFHDISASTSICHCYVVTLMRRSFDKNHQCATNEIFHTPLISLLCVFLDGFLVLQYSALQK